MFCNLRGTGHHLSGECQPVGSLLGNWAAKTPASPKCQLVPIVVSWSTHLWQPSCDNHPVTSDKCQLVRVVIATRGAFMWIGRPAISDQSCWLCPSSKELPRINKPGYYNQIPMATQELCSLLYLWTHHSTNPHQRGASIMAMNTGFQSWIVQQ